MVKNEEVIRQILENVFNKLTTGVLDFTELYGFKTAEIRVSGIIRTIGVGFYIPSAKMKIFYINDRCDQNGNEKFSPVLEIGYRNSEGVAAWGMEFVDDITLIAQVGNFQLGVANIQAMYHVMQLIEEEEQLILKQG